MKPVYQAYDGEIFEDRVKAIDHEGELFDLWLDDLIEGGIQIDLTTVVRHFNDSHHLTCSAEGFYRTPWESLKESLRTYWEDITFDN